MSSSKPNLASAYLSGFEKSLTMKKATHEDAKVVTLVFWDIHMYPVPRGFDPRRVQPCIKRVMEDYGYSGPLSITAFGVLKDVPNDILRGVYSSGISLTNVPFDHIDMMDHISGFTEMNPPPANIISISEPDPGLLNFVQTMGYNILMPFPNYDSFESFLLTAESRAPDEEEICEYAYWDCLVCRRDPPGQGFEALTTHLSSEEHQELLLECLPRDHFLPCLPLDVDPKDVTSTPFNRYWAAESPSACHEIDPKAITSVFWDINECPVPLDFDPRLVSPCIKRFLENLDYSGPLITITAVGLLSDVPEDVLRAVSSTGIVLHNVPHGTKDIMGLVFEFTLSKPPPANIVVIIDPGSGLSKFIQPWGYNLLLQPSLETFLVAVPGALEEDKGSETGGSACWFCSVCSPDQAFQGFENLTMHLSSRPHQRKMLDWLPWNARFSQSGNPPGVS